MTICFCMFFKVFFNLGDGRPVKELAFQGRQVANMVLKLDFQALSLFAATCCKHPPVLFVNILFLNRHPSQKQPR